MAGNHEDDDDVANITNHLGILNVRTGNENPSSYLKKKLEVLEESYMLNMAVHIGFELNLFETIAAISSRTVPASVTSIAYVADCKERYVKEWLAIMAVADIIEVNPEDKFWIRPQDLNTLYERDRQLQPSDLLRDTNLLPHIVECMKKDGPYGIHPDRYVWRKHELRDAADHMNQLEEVELMCNTSIDESILNRLKGGNLRVLELGCGTGVHLAVFATLYPGNKYLGVDSDRTAIQTARWRRKPCGSKLRNLSFVCGDALNLPQDWDDSFDFVFIHYSVHDMAYPDKCFDQCFRVLDPKGVLIMVDSAASTRIHDNKMIYGHSLVLQYCVSLFQCIPLSSSDRNSLCLGSMCPKDKFLELLYDAGFVNVLVASVPRLPPTSGLYTCFKTRP